MKNKIVIILILFVSFYLFFGCIPTREVVTQKFYNELEQKSSGAFNNFRFVISKDVTLIKIDDTQVKTDLFKTKVILKDQVWNIYLNSDTKGRIQPETTREKLKIAFEKRFVEDETSSGIFKKYVLKAFPIDFVQKAKYKDDKYYFDSRIVPLPEKNAMGILTGKMRDAVVITYMGDLWEVKWEQKKDDTLEPYLIYLKQGQVREQKRRMWGIW